MPAWPAVAHLAAFLAGSAVWVAVLGVLGAVVLLAQGLDPATPGDLGAGPLGALSILQTLGMTGLAAALATRLPPAPDGRWSAVFPLSPAGGWWLAGLLAGLTIWTFPSWLADQLSAWADPATLEMIAHGLTTGPLLGRATLALAVAGSAPLLEELVFRGYVWRVLEVYGDRRVALVGSTVLFCTYHLDPVQSVALLPTALALGWLRLRSGSITPAIAAHFVNNALGVALAGHEAPMPAWLALLGAAVTLATFAGAEVVRARSLSR